MPIDPEALRQWPIAEIEHTYTARDTMLYALGLGCGGDPLDENQLRFVYEGRLQALPSMSVVLGYPGFWIGDPATGKSEALETQTGRQFVIATVNSLEGYPIEDYAYRLGRAWKIGDEKRDDGVF